MLYPNEIIMGTDNKGRIGQDDGRECLNSGHGWASAGNTVAVTQEGVA
jgi:hypothetical protein